jgi:hypothetical protein
MMPCCLGPCHTLCIPSKHTVVLYLRCYLKSDTLMFEIMQVSEEGQLEVACMLIKRGTGVSAQDKDSQTLLHQVSKEDEPEVACMLVKHSVDVSDHWPAHLTCI